MARHEKDWALSLFTEVLGLPSPHCGLWNGEERTLANMAGAQRRFIAMLQAWIPPRTTSILHVGSGTPDVARTLTARGRVLTCVSPDPAQAPPDADPTVHHHQGRFGDFPTGARYDLVLFSETCDDVDPDGLFQRCRELLVPGGHVLAASMFRRARTDSYRHHVFDEWLESAQMHDFTVVRHEDVTERTLPTMQLLHRIATEYAAPSIGFALRALRSGHRLRDRVRRLVMRKDLDAFEGHVLHPVVARLDPDRFAREALCAFVLLKLSV